ncbi:oxidoreductase, short chain dehydrogenase/reductase family protein [Cryptosporidium muris RN66]|uniref:Oxidoreductase, short chain dehydrogenase/reductase family protein n=1 Tax=Cryptosporidium muris (strain RN66) TaxID=441375 RepID=B6A984_CRYMR|nr:oxidoreductase, short chain dehydrogenase/reductase family protein [Cryptosporidium muris RN66]EEA04775.1 oxidoreductase, short chain dehydrogenase/reductase family protein [Cryptosporidium muris RN66]|eukprot:XP_002139124.1 oxidoreductase, short chain dehydrogenase/reductase family protein [Cryptosporidium muris RN66]
MILEGRVAIITGGLSGLGRAVIQRLIQDDIKVICIFDCEVPKSSVSKPSNVHFEKVNLTDFSSIQEALKRVVNMYGRVDILIHCAGITHCATPIIQREVDGSILDNNRDIPDIWEEVIKVNVISTLNTIHCIAPYLARNTDDEKGVIILISSSVARDGSIHNQGYIASKGAINSITLPIARELGPMGIRVVTIAPGIFDTPVIRRSITDDDSSKLLDSIPLGRFGDPDEFAQIVVETAIKSSYLTGEIIHIDGAWRSTFTNVSRMQRLSVNESNTNEIPSQTEVEENVLN